MTTRRRILIILGIAIFALLAVPIALLSWVCYTESGLRWIVSRAENLGTVQMRFTNVSGTLAGPLAIERFELQHPRARIAADKIEADLNLSAVWLQTLQAGRFSIENIDVRILPRTEPPKPREPRFLPGWLRIDADAITVGHAHLTLANGREIDAKPIGLGASITTRRLELRAVKVASGPYTVAGNLAILASDPTAMEGELHWTATLPKQPRYAGSVKVDGDLNEVRFGGTLSQPFAVALAGSARLVSAWSWNARVQAPAATLTPWQPQSKLGRFAAVIQGDGSSDGIALSGVVTPADAPLAELGPVEVALEGAFAQRKLRADSLVLALTKSQTAIRSQGEIAFDGGPPTLQLDGRWSHLRWPLKGTAQVASDAGRFSLRGPLPYTYTIDGDFKAPRNIAGRIVAEGELDKTSVTARKLDARVLGGTLQGNASFSWAEDKPWQAGLAARNLNPELVNEAFDGRIAFDLDGRGRGFDAKGAWRIDLSGVRGTVRSQPLTGRASVERNRDTFHVRNTDLYYGSGRLVADGTYGPKHNLHVALTADDMSRLIPEARGRVDMVADLSGTDDRPELIFTLEAQQLAYRMGEQTFGVESIVANADVDLSDREPSTVRVQAQGLTLAERRIASLNLNADGTGGAHTFSLKADAGNVKLELATRSAYARKEWAGTIEQLAVAVADTNLKLETPARYVASPTRMELASFCLTDGKSRACGEGNWAQGGPWQVQANATAIPLRLLAAGLPRPSEYSGLLALDVRASGAAGTPFTGNAVVDFSDGVFSYKRASGKLESLPIGTGRAKATATAEQFTLDANLDAGEDASLDASLRSQRLAGRSWKAFPLRGQAKGRTTRLGFVPVLMPEVDRAGGELTADLTVGGTLGAPELEGSVVLAKGELDLYAINLMLREVAARLELKGNTLRLVANAAAGKGKVAVEGQIAWDQGKPAGTLRISGENLQLVNVPEAQIVASPNLRFRMEGRRVDVDGAVRIPSAQLAPANLSGAKLPSEDEMIVGEQRAPPENRLQVTTGVHVILGDDVHIDSYGLTGKLTGGVLVYLATGEVSTGIGEIEVEDGEYVLYTRTFEIERGRLVFSGGPLGDPGVDLRAIRRQPDLVAGVNVRGSLRAPRLSFFSDPPLTQSQIASILVTGRTLDSIQDEGSTTASDQRERWLAQGGALLAGELGEQLGIKDLTVETDAENPSALVLGTYLSPRLFVSYGVSLAESINTFKLRYTLGDRWTLKTEAGENQSADVVYTIER